MLKVSLLVDKYIHFYKGKYLLISLLRKYGNTKTISSVPAFLSTFYQINLSIGPKILLQVAPRVDSIVFLV